MAEKVIYLFDETSKEFQGSNLVEDDHTLAAGETEIAPEQGLYQPATFDGTKWVGTDKVVYDAEQEKVHQAYLAEHPIQPDASDTAIAQLALQIATNKTQQDQTNAQLLLATAQQTAKETN